MNTSLKTLEIVDATTGYEVPESLFRLLREAVEYVPPAYLAGLGEIVVRDKGSLTRSERRRRYRNRGVSYRMGEAKGLYYSPTKGQRGRIVIFADNVLGEYGPVLSRLPVFGDYIGTHTFFHELGHHLASFVRPSSGHPERLAENWERSLTTGFLTTKYRWLRVAARIAQRLGLVRTRQREAPKERPHPLRQAEMTKKSNDDQ